MYCPVLTKRVKFCPFLKNLVQCIKFSLNQAEKELSDVQNNNMAQNWIDWHAGFCPVHVPNYEAFLMHFQSTHLNDSSKTAMTLQQKDKWVKWHNEMCRMRFDMDNWDLFMIHLCMDHSDPWELPPPIFSVEQSPNHIFWRAIGLVCAGEKLNQFEKVVAFTSSNTVVCRLCARTYITVFQTIPFFVNILVRNVQKYTQANMVRLNGRMLILKFICVMLCFIAT